MYILNVMETFDPKKVYCCNKFIKDYLVYVKHFSLLGQSIDGNWLFAKTEKLKEAIADLPLHLKLVNNLDKGGE